MGVVKEIGHLEGINDELLIKKTTYSNFSYDLRNSLAIIIFKIASCLSEPICKSHEFYRKISLVDQLNSTSNKVLNFIKKFFFFNGILFFSFLAVFTTIPGIFLRCLGAQIANKPFVYLKGNAEEKKLSKDKSFNLLSWNICGINGGYCISDGGVVPWSERIDKIIEKILSTDSDVICLNEVFDIKTGYYLFKKLKDKYSHFYFNIGPRAIGVNSGLMVACKYQVGDPKFISYPKEFLVDRTKSSEKGVFSFDLIDRNNNFARIFSTHLQHSEEPSFSTQEEKIARKKEMELIIEKIKEIKNKAIILTGDLNLDDDEYKISSWSKNFLKKVIFQHPLYTWGGDSFCAKMVGKRVSSSLNLDHTLIVKNTASNIKSSLIETGYIASKFQKEALSDHLGLFSTINI
jgi:exonuclease III